MRTKIFLMTYMLLSLIACDDYLDIKPKGKNIPTTTNDYDELMGNPTLFKATYPLAEAGTDDVFADDQMLGRMASNPTGKAYLWLEDHYTELQDDIIWQNAYNAIYNCNLIIQDIDHTEGTVEEKERIKAEALINRAYYYWFLVNIYGKAYTVTTASTDLGVPLVLKPDLEMKPGRKSVKEVYDQITDDLYNALKLSLPDEGRNVFRPDKYSAYALLARVYLYMNNYNKSLEFANKALQGNSQLVDYKIFSFVNPENPHAGVNNKPFPENNPEVIFYREPMLAAVRFISNFTINPDFMDLIGDKDLRFVFQFSDLDSRGKPIREPYPKSIVDMEYSISVPEMLLTKAECLLRVEGGEIESAINILNTLRKNRFMDEDYNDLSASTRGEALQLVLNERRIELYGKGLRWFDLKRLNKETAFRKTIERVFDGQTYTLAPESNRYLFPISDKIIDLNSNIEPNPR